MADEASRSKELGAFLQHKRRQLDPRDVGLPAAGRRRTPGLRREEVCLISGVGITWYTWLEQGRSGNPSAQVIESIARALRLTDAETDHVRRLAGIPLPDAGAARTTLPPHGQHVLDALCAAPAFAITRDWSIVGWNDLYARFFPGISTLVPGDRNLLWLLWTNPDVHDLLANWETDVRRFTATFRAYASGHLHTEPVSSLIKRLQDADDEFKAAWANHDIERFTSRERDFEHPVVGRLTLEAHQLTLEDAPGIHLVVYTAAPGSPTAVRLHQLREASP